MAEPTLERFTSAYPGWPCGRSDRNLSMTDAGNGRNPLNEQTTIVVRPATSNSDVGAVRVLFRRYAESLSFSLAYQGFDAEIAGLPTPYVPPEGSLLVAKRGFHS